MKPKIKWADELPSRVSKDVVEHGIRVRIQFVGCKIVHSVVQRIKFQAEFFSNLHPGIGAHNLGAICEAKHTAVGALN